MEIPLHLTTYCGHKATIAPVRKTGGPHEGKWQVRVEQDGGRRPPKVLYSDPCEQAAILRFAEYLGIPETTIEIDSARMNETGSPKTTRNYTTATPVTPPPPAQPRPLDTFELSPNGRACCRECRDPITMSTQRVGIQEWSFSRWNPAYYHRKCCTDDMLRSLHLGDEEGNRQDDSSTDSVEKKLRAELERQVDARAAKRSLVYGKRKDLREELRQLRRRLANQRLVDAYQVFDNSTLDDIVAKLPRTEMQLLKCHGIAQRRCELYGQAILEIVARHQED